MSNAVMVEGKNRVEIHQHKDGRFTLSLHTVGNYADAVIYMDMSSEVVNQVMAMLENALVEAEMGERYADL